MAKTTRTEPTDASAGLQDQILSLQNRVSKLEATIQARRIGPADGELPPLPTRIGKKFEGTRRDIRARIDGNLFQRLNKMATDDFGGNISRCLDVILWAYFDQPPLSFQNPKDQLPTKA